MLLLVSIILILIYLFSALKAKKAKFGYFGALTFRLIIFIAGPLLVTVLIAEKYNIYPRQYWITKGLFWLVFFSCMSAYGLCSSKYFAIVERMIYKIIFFSPLLFLLILLIPFIGIGYDLLFYARFIGDNKFVLYSDNKIRIEQPYIRFMGPNPQPVLYVKKTFTSFQDTILPFGYDDVRDKIEVKGRDDSSYLIIYKTSENWQVPSGTDTFLYREKH